jgi:2-C-methyl-D-erythritol 4-phosphate cytidylyltransferase/2-C-methyl-D-erythritol 2,4-cyclodiphosphate synthase
MAAMQLDASKVAAIVVAAGSGARAGGAKQWRLLAGRPVARWSLEALAAAGARPLVLVVRAGDEQIAHETCAGLPDVRVTTGGEARTDSVRAGLEALARSAPELVLIHDAARPLLSLKVVQALIHALEDAEGAAPALPVADTLKRASDGRVTATEPREGLWQVQTPQAFRYAEIVRAYAALPTTVAPTDDLAVLERSGGRVRLTRGDPRLMKLTYPEDIDMAEQLAGAARITRVGLGLDAHRFGPGDGVWLCGVKVPSDRMLIGHSDADAGLHALTDALLGAIGEGDIGDHFPPSDPRWRGAPSHLFLSHALELAVARGGRLINVDVTIICERPRVKPHREAMRARLSEILSLPLDRVSVKATTTEAMGFTGREEGLAAQALATVETPA